jgi:zinc protease
MALAPRAGLVPGTAAAQGSSSIKIPFESYTLANGLTVITSIDRTTPTVAVNMWYHLRS